MPGNPDDHLVPITATPTLTAQGKPRTHRRTAQQACTLSGTKSYSHHWVLLSVQHLVKDRGAPPPVPPPVLPHQHQIIQPPLVIQTTVSTAPERSYNLPHLTLSKVLFVAACCHWHLYHHHQYSTWSNTEERSGATIAASCTRTWL